MLSPPCGAARGRRNKDKRRSCVEQSHMKCCCKCEQKPTGRWLSPDHTSKASSGSRVLYVFGFTLPIVLPCLRFRILRVPFEDDVTWGFKVLSLVGLVSCVLSKSNGSISISLLSTDATLYLPP